MEFSDVGLSLGFIKNPDNDRCLIQIGWVSYCLEASKLFQLAVAGLSSSRKLVPISMKTFIESMDSLYFKNYVDNFHKLILDFLNLVFDGERLNALKHFLGIWIY